MEVANSVALVTGAGQGIGCAIAHALAAAGVHVGVNALHQETADRTCQTLTEQGVRAIAVSGTVADDGLVSGMVQTVTQKLGPIDILVNNAAAPAVLRSFSESTLEEQHDELVTLVGTLNCTRHVCPQMIERKTGRIVNISSIASRHAMPQRAVYSAANAGIDTFTRSMAKELGQFGITVNAVSPGATESPRFRARTEEVRQSNRRAIALNRFAEPEEIAATVMFLLSDQANYINGAILDVDGGFSGYPPLQS